MKELKIIAHAKDLSYFNRDSLISAVDNARNLPEVFDYGSDQGFTYGQWELPSLKTWYNNVGEI